MSLSASSFGGRAHERLDVEPVVDRVQPRGDGAGAVLEREPGARGDGVVAEPAHGGGELARDRRPCVGGGEQVAAADVELVLQRDRHRQRRGRGVDGAGGRLDPRHARARARGQHDDLVAHGQRAGGEPPGVAARAAGRVAQRRAARAGGRRRRSARGRAAAPRGGRAADRRRTRAGSRSARRCCRRRAPRPG